MYVNIIFPPMPALTPTEKKDFLDSGLTIGETNHARWEGNHLSYRTSRNASEVCRAVEATELGTLRGVWLLQFTPEA